MRVAIAGGHGQIARHLTRLLTGRGHHVRALVRNPDHVDDVVADGAEAVVADLESDDVAALADAIGEVDAVVFAAGAGPGSGPTRKDTVDHRGAVKLAAAAGRTGIRRYVLVSSVGADPDVAGDDVFQVYLRAKGRAEVEVAAAGLDHTIVRPVALTDDPPTGQVQIGDARAGAQITRADVAAVLAAVLDRPSTVGHTFVVAAGDTPVDDAIAAFAST